MVLSRVPLALLAATVLIVAQGFAIGRIELTFDEAYYTMWARWPQAGYLDHPPMVAWMIAASQALFGRSEFGVRALFWAGGAVLPALVYALGRRLYGDTQLAATAALFYVGAPLAAGAPLATPDTPLVLFWTLALLGLVEVWRGSPWGWALVGAATGAAGLSKMTAGFLGLGVALALIAAPSLRREWARPGPYAAAALALFVLSPFLFWNATHGFATFFKQGGRLTPHGFSPRYLAEFLGSQLLLFNPLTAALALRGAVLRRGAPEEATRLLLAVSAPLLAYFLIHALHDRVQGNWPAPLYPALALLAARATREPAPSGGDRRASPGRPPAAPSFLMGEGWGEGGAPSGAVPLPKGEALAAALGVAAALAVYAHLATGWPPLGRGDPTLRIGGWRELAAEVDALARQRDLHVVEAQGYAATSLLSFYGAPSLTAVESGEAERWSFRPRVPIEGKRLVLGPSGFAKDLGGRFSSVTSLGALRRRVGGVDLESYDVLEAD